MELRTIDEIRENYSLGKLDPLDVFNYYFDKIKKLDPKFHAWVCFNLEAAEKKATLLKEKIKKNEKLKALDGIPVGVKDIFNTIDFPTQMGSPLWKGFTPGNDARCVYDIKENGGIILGKTVTAEFAVHTLNETLNPHNILRTPGTSSSGSAVAVLLDMVPVALGTQTAGSIVRPASFCGVFGCKPSFGLIPRTGILKTTDSLDSVGFFTNKLGDIKTVFDMIRVKGSNYPWSNSALADKSRQNKADNKPWKVAFIKTHTWDNAPEYAKSSVLDFVKEIQKNAAIAIEETDISSIISEVHKTHAIIYNKTLSYYFSQEHKESKLISPVFNELIESGKQITLQQYRDALNKQNEIIEAVDKFFLNYDIVFSLSTSGEAPERNVLELPDPSLIWTFSHLPVVSVPIFKSPNNLPFGLQFCARKYNDYLLFDFLKFLSDSNTIPKTIWDSGGNEF